MHSPLGTAAHRLRSGLSQGVPRGHTSRHASASPVHPDLFARPAAPGGARQRSPHHPPRSALSRRCSSPVAVSAVQSSESGNSGTARILVSGVGFSPGEPVFIAIHDQWANVQHETRWVSASMPVLQPPQDLAPGEGFSVDPGGSIGEFFEIPVTVTALPGDNQNPVLGPATSQSVTMPGIACATSLMVRAYDRYPPPGAISSKSNWGAKGQAMHGCAVLRSRRDCREIGWCRAHLPAGRRMVRRHALLRPPFSAIHRTSRRKPVRWRRFAFASVMATSGWIAAVAISVHRMSAKRSMNYRVRSTPSRTSPTGRPCPSSTLTWDIPPHSQTQ
jgi:hypothetical protein